MKFAFRAEATQTLGAGHVMRCLSLANELRLRGAETCFIVVDILDHLEVLVRSNGHALKRLPSSVKNDEIADVQATIQAEQFVTAYVLDHYSLGAVWESKAQEHALVLAIDDLGRAHTANWILDQNFYENPQQKYAGRLSNRSRSFFGPMFALLRPEFRCARRTSKVRNNGIRHVLVFLGGTDADNLTSRALKAVELGLPATVKVTVIAGASHPALASLEAWCSLRGHASLKIQVEDMTPYMLEADLAIGAAGSNTWERCACGLPTVALCLAVNQQEVIREGTLAGFLWGFDGVPSIEALTDVLKILERTPRLLAHMSQQALGITDARGTQRIADILMPKVVLVRLATLGDAQKIYDWRTHPNVKNMSRTSLNFSFEDHCKWLQLTLENSKHILLIGLHQDREIGVVRFYMNDERSEVSIFLAPNLAGSGLGSALLRAAEIYLQTTHPSVRWLDAWVNSGNQPSINMFNQLGYSNQISRFEREIV